MSLIYWENVLVDPAVPFDITFRITEYDDHDNEDEEVVEGAGAVSPGKVSLISAHRLILGLTSPVFRSQLSGRWAQSQDEVIDVEDVTPSAFRTMINYMYGVPLTYSVEFLTLEKAQELFDTVYAAKKYLVPQLIQEIVALINKTSITTNTLEVDKMERMAKHYSHLEEASQALLLKCKEEREEAVKEAKYVSSKENQPQLQVVGDAIALPGPGGDANALQGPDVQVDGAAVDLPAAIPVNLLALHPIDIFLDQNVLEVANESSDTDDESLAVAENMQAIAGLEQVHMDLELSNDQNSLDDIVDVAGAPEVIPDNHAPSENVNIIMQDLQSDNDNEQLEPMDNSLVGELFRIG